MNPGILTPPTQFATMPRGLLGRPTPVPMIDARRVFDPDAERYITAVERADGRPLEEAVRVAIGEFVIGCKEDGIWSAIRASCILMGARTLSGALVPLAGTAPTNNNFVSGDYNRKTGLIGNGTTKWLDSNRNNNSESQNSKHLSCYVSAASTASVSGRPYVAAALASGSSHLHGGGTNNRLSVRANTNTSIFDLANTESITGFIGVTRSDGTNTDYRYSGATTKSNAAPSVTPANGFIGVFYGTGTGYSDGRFAFYSVGSSLTLSLLDTRVSTLYAAIGNAIA